ncbi:DUF3105 domain-containing protein [Candidatus Gracilibacteria bacterium]|nr:DUF3105 domain-containing protein [Candidatus Gracilibacteria bacterium]
MDTEQPLTKKERRQKRREERKAMRTIQQKKTSQQRTGKWIVTLCVIGLSIYVFSLLVSQTRTSRPGESIAIQGREHIPIGSPSPEYNSNPPTSGPHYVKATNWGVYQEELQDENLVHSLEHGGIWISYQPNIDEETKEQLEAIGKTHSGSVVVSPRSANDSPIAIASWGRLEKLIEFDEEDIIEFIKRNKNRSPEPFAQ